MENRYVAQALQEMLAELPLEDREEWILLFTERVEALEAEEGAERMDSNVPQGWEGIAGYEADKGPDHGADDFQELVKRTQPVASGAKSFPLAAVLGLAALALIEAAIIVVLLISGGGKSGGPADPNGVVIAPNSGYDEPAETVWTSEDILEPQTTPKQQVGPESPSDSMAGETLDPLADPEVQGTQAQQTDPEAQGSLERQTDPEAQGSPEQQTEPE